MNPAHDRRAAAYGEGVDASTLEAPREALDRSDRVKHGYPPPARAAGSVVSAYCGASMVVAGEYDDAPPGDACPLCALAWDIRQDGVPVGP
jgi:hypothetical protein